DDPNGEKRAAGLGEACGNRHGDRCAESELAEEAARALRAVASEPAKQLLRSMAEHRGSHHDAEEQQSVRHGSPLRGCSEGSNDSCGINYSRGGAGETAAGATAAAFASAPPRGPGRVSPTLARASSVSDTAASSRPVGARRKVILCPCPTGSALRVCR